MSIVNFIKGIFIGIALVIPGLSGSIFAVVVGLYEDILDAINNFKQDLKRYIVFLLPIAFGVAVGILASTKAILWACVEYPIWSYLFFVGLVIGSFPLVIKKMNQIKMNPLYFLISIASFFCIMFLTSLESGGDQAYIAITSLTSVSDFMTMAFAGVFSVSLMAIPGVSGSVMLMVINQYGTVYNAVGTSVDLLQYLVTGKWDLLLETIPVVLLVLPFGIGALIGIVFIAKIMGYLIKHFESQTYYGVFGVVVAAVVTLLKTGVIDNLHTVSFRENGLVLIILGLVCIVVGFLCTVFLDAPKKEEKSIAK